MCLLLKSIRFLLFKLDSLFACIMISMILIFLHILDKCVHLARVPHIHLYITQFQTDHIILWFLAQPSKVWYFAWLCPNVWPAFFDYRVSIYLKNRNYFWFSNLIIQLSFIFVIFSSDNSYYYMFSLICCGYHSWNIFF